MTTLRTAVQQALEALEQSETTVRYEGFGLAHREAERKHQAAIAALRTALAQQQAEPLNLLDRAVQRRLAAQWGYVPAQIESKPLEPDIAKIVSDNLGKLYVEDPAEPAQEPVAWRTFDGEGGYEYRDYEDNEVYAAAWAQRNPRHAGWVEPLYTAPPQRQPLTEEEIKDCFHAARNAKLGASKDNSKHRLSVMEIARAIERAHGIIEPRIEEDSRQTLDDAMRLPRAMAQAYENGYKAGVAAEREACAKLCEARFVGDMTREDMEARRCAAAIRARGNT